MRMFGRKKGQTSLEYIMIIGGAIMFVVLVVLIIRTGILEKGKTKVGADVSAYADTYLQNYLFFDNFDGGTSSKWTPLSGTWQIQNGKYTQTDAADDRYSLTKQAFTNFTMEFKVRRTSASNYVGGVIRATADGANMYVMSLTDSTLYLTEKQGVTITIVDAAAIFPAVPIDTSEVTVKIKAYGNNIKILVNGQQLIDYTDTGPPIYTSGKVGLYTCKTCAGGTGATAAFDEVRVWKE